MVEISAAMVKELREATNVGMMECKKALVESGGDKDKAMKLLRERGLAIAEKKASRTANEGVVASCLAEDGKSGSLIEVNCETDFVAKNEKFLAFASELAKKALDTDESLAEKARDEVTAQIAEIGENIIICRNCRFVLEDEGAVTSYVHFGNRIGVLLDLGCEKAETTTQSAFKDLLKDIALHIAAAGPRYLDRSAVPEDVVASEREIFATQVKDKPANIIDKIVDGKMGKFYSQVCLVEQAFIKDQDVAVNKLIENVGKDLGDNIEIRRFERYEVGGSR